MALDLSRVRVSKPWLQSVRHLFSSQFPATPLLTAPPSLCLGLLPTELLSALTAAMSGQDPSRKGNTVLVVDDFALDVINACVSQADLLKAGFMTVCPFEKKKELAAGLRRRRYDKFDALYFMRPKKANLEKVVEDFRDDVPEAKPDLLERLFPCIFKGIPDLEVRV
jgi:hypothetical protein